MERVGDFGRPCSSGNRDGILIALLLFLFWRGRFLRFLKTVKIPMWDLIFLVLFIVLVDISEHYNCSIFHGEIDEELFECAMYFEMLRVTGFVFKNKKQV